MLAGFFFTLPPSRPLKKFFCQSDEIRNLFLISSQDMSLSARYHIRSIFPNFVGDVVAQLGDVVAQLAKATG
jgi:hypothetical protein